jgi:uncharacterized circularly permuted ATP-grasp superfamily protein
MDQPQTSNLLSNYSSQGLYCELTTARPCNQKEFQIIIDRLKDFNLNELIFRTKEAEGELYNLGITFTVYSERDAIDRILPFDVIPRLINRDEWHHIESGVIQRVKAINLFLQDVYGQKKILKDGIIPRDLVLGNANYREEMNNIRVSSGTYAHVCGIDLIRDLDGQFLVLEDNARTPSGVSYVVENRTLMLRTFPDLMEGIAIQPVDDYGLHLHKALASIAPADKVDPQVVLLSPGIYNSAFFEHIFLAREMGVPLVEGRDLLVENDRVYMRTSRGLKRIHTIYRRLNDDFLDPEAFRPDSQLGVPGLMRAYQKGNIALANAVGTGVADDKAVYAYLPRIIKYYLDQDAILPNVETHICREPDALAYTLDNMDKLVIKPVGESGGYGLLIGPKASKSELNDFKQKLKKSPSNYVSQPMIPLSVVPTLNNEKISARHVDLRPFAVTGQSTWVLPGGLTRVALQEGSIVVNSSQGGGSKDTWVLK